jgi:hypothetical protein
MPLEPKTLSIASDLAASALEQAAEMLGTIEPFTYLCCASGNVEYAREAIKGWNGIEIAVVPAGALADPDCWFLVGPNGVVWSGKV